MQHYNIKNYDSNGFSEFRELPPGYYAKNHPQKLAEPWKPTIDPSKPVFEESKSKAYTKASAKIN